MESLNPNDVIWELDQAIPEATPGLFCYGANKPPLYLSSFGVFSAPGNQKSPKWQKQLWGELLSHHWRASRGGMVPCETADSSSPSLTGSGATESPTQGFLVLRDNLPWHSWWGLRTIGSVSRIKYGISQKDKSAQQSLVYLGRWGLVRWGPSW